MCMSPLYMLSGWSDSCHWFRVLLWGLPRVPYEDVVTTSLVESCSFYSIYFGYVSDALQDVNISNICLFGIEEWSSFYFLVSFWTKTRTKSFFKDLEQCFHPALIPLLLTLSRFSRSYLYVLFCLAYSVISVLLSKGS